MLGNTCVQSAILVGGVPLNMTTPTAMIRIEPDAVEWRRLLPSPWQLSAQQRALRAHLGLPTDRPIILAGHQPAFWHPGVLAKYIACHAASDAFSAAAAWIVVDHDAADLTSLAYPGLDEHPGAGLIRADAPFLPRTNPEVPAVYQPPLALGPRVSRPAEPCVDNGLDRIARALEASRGETNAARQLTAAVRELLSAHLPAVRTVYSSDVSKSDLWRDIVTRMNRDPIAAARAYNIACAERPDAGIAPLLIDPASGRCELPLWRMHSGGPRERVFAHELEGLDPESLAPKALLLTGLLRIAACDLYIHGTGGAAYDAASEAWLRSWIGAALAPTALVTADLRIPHPSADVAPEEVHRAAWRAHRAKHDPSLLGAHALAEEKARLVGLIRRAVEESRSGGRQADAGTLYQQLHALLASYRAAHSQELNVIEQEYAQALRHFASQDIAQNRTWAFPLHEPASIRRLVYDIADCFNATRGAPARLCGLGA